MVTIDSPTRVTLSLDIIRRLPDGPCAGYHELSAVKHQIALADTLHIDLSTNNRKDNGDLDIIRCDDPLVPCCGDNICVKACRLFRERFWQPWFFDIAIDKRIPVMGGLAGGSANAAATLRALDSIWGLRLTTEQLRDLGRQLGMDVPYFFDGGTAFDSEAGGTLRPIDTALKLHIVLAIPGFGVGTKEAYESIDYGRVAKNAAKTERMIEAFSKNDFGGVVESMHNDFELSVFERYPKLREIRDNLINAGCAAACMTGSGSTIVGIAEDGDSAREIADRMECRTIVTETLNVNSFDKL